MYFLRGSCSRRRTMCNVTPVFPRDLDLPAKKTPPEVSTTTTMTTTSGYLEQMRASVSVASVPDPREYRRPKEKKTERDANSFLPRAPSNPLGNSHRLRVTVFVAGRTRRLKRKGERRQEERRRAGRKEGLEEENLRQINLNIDTHWIRSKGFGRSLLSRCERVAIWIFSSG